MPARTDRSLAGFLPYPEPGIRLIRQDDIGPLNLQLYTEV
jgi:hypothetical protein